MYARWYVWSLDKRKEDEGCNFSPDLLLRAFPIRLIKPLYHNERIEIKLFFIF
jgi:hypothetical protein